MPQGLSRVNQGKELRSPLHLYVVAIEEEAFWSPATTVANSTLLTFKLRAYTKLIYLKWNCF